MTRIYNNGNYQVHLLEDGTKKRLSLDGTFVPKRVETLDINLSYKCYQGCKYCYINASPEGNDCTSESLARLFFEYDIPKHTELAFNYNSEHPEFDKWYSGEYFGLEDYVTNLTINSNLLNKEENVTKFQSWIDKDRVKGIGVSTNKFIDNMPLKTNNIVYHTIAGITPVPEIVKMLEHNQKVLILGYKTLGRANKTIDLSEWNIRDILDVKMGIVSFDNLALEQLKLKDIVSNETWESHYMGEEGTTSFYIDLVSETFSQSSIDSEVKFTCKDLKIKDMFEIIKRRIR